MDLWYRILITYFILQAVTEEQKEKVRKYGLECVEESGADKEEVKKLKSGETTEVSVIITLRNPYVL